MKRGQGKDGSQHKTVVTICPLGWFDSHGDTEDSPVTANTSARPLPIFLAALVLVAAGSFSVVCGLLPRCGWSSRAWSGSVVEALGLSCPAACGISIPQPGIEPAFPALEGGFLTNGPPGES